MGIYNKQVRHSYKGGRQKYNETIRKQMYELRESTNKFYFGGQDYITKQYHHPKFRIRHNKATLDKLWYPYLQNL